MHMYNVHVILGIVTWTPIPSVIMDIQLLHTLPYTCESHTNHRAFRDVLDCKPTTREAAPLDEMSLLLRLRRERILDMITEQVHKVT